MLALFVGGHIGHARGHWDGKECHGDRFSFRPTKSAFSIFRVLKLGFFVNRLPKREIESWEEHPT
jgi:hypothetical protein